MEIVVVLAVGVLLFLGVRMFMQRQAQRMNQRLQEEITPQRAREAALALNDEQHKAIYQAIGVEDARRALGLFKEATGASIKDSIVAVQALHRYPQSAPSAIRFEEDFNLNSEDVIKDESLEDAIDDLRDDLNEEGPIAEADPNTGEILGENSNNVPDIPGGEQPSVWDEEKNDDDVDARARELLEKSGFDPDKELTIPEDWDVAGEDQAGFHLEVQRGEEKITLSHEDLQPWVHDQLYALLRDDEVDQAASLLAANSPLTHEEAHRFLVVFKNQS